MSSKSFDEFKKATKIEEEANFERSEVESKTEEEKFYSKSTIDFGMIKDFAHQINQKTKEKEEELEGKIYKAKGNFVDFLSGLLDSYYVRLWLKIFLYFVLFVFIWFIMVSMYDFMYHEKPKELFVNVWKSSFEFIKLVFAIIGGIAVFIKLFLNGKV